MYGLYGMYGYYDGGQKCCKDPANTRLDLRNAANSLQIDLKGRGCYLGTHTMGGRNTEHETIYIYIIHIYMCNGTCSLERHD